MSQRKAAMVTINFVYFLHLILTNTFILRKKERGKSVILQSYITVYCPDHGILFIIPSFILEMKARMIKTQGTVFEDWEPLILDLLVGIQLSLDLAKSITV